MIDSKFDWAKASQYILNLQETLKYSLHSPSGKYAIFRFCSYDCLWEGEGWYVNDVYQSSNRIVLPVEALYLSESRFQAAVRKAMSTQIQSAGHTFAEKDKVRRIYVNETYSSLDCIELYTFEKRNEYPIGRFELIPEISDEVE